MLDGSFLFFRSVYFKLFELALFIFFRMEGNDQMNNKEWRIVLVFFIILSQCF